MRTNDFGEDVAARYDDELGEWGDAAAVAAHLEPGGRRR
jgi:hypothetical protein